jgi:hypothetical protein
MVQHNVVLFIDLIKEKFHFSSAITVI